MTQDANIPSLLKTMQSRTGITTSQAVIHHGPQRTVAYDAISQALKVLHLQAEAHEAPNERVCPGFTAAHRRGRVGSDDVTHVLFVSAGKT